MADNFVDGFVKTTHVIGTRQWRRRSSFFLQTVDILFQQMHTVRQEPNSQDKDGSHNDQRNNQCRIIIAAAARGIRGRNDVRSRRCGLVDPIARFEMTLFARDLCLGGRFGNKLGTRLDQMRDKVLLGLGLPSQKRNGKVTLQVRALVHTKQHSPVIKSDVQFFRRIKRTNKNFRVFVLKEQAGDVLGSSTQQNANVVPLIVVLIGDKRLDVVDVQIGIVVGNCDLTQIGNSHFLGCLLKPTTAIDQHNVARSMIKAQRLLDLSGSKHELPSEVTSVEFYHAQMVLQSHVSTKVGSGIYRDNRDVEVLAQLDRIQNGCAKQGTIQVQSDQS
mmetsp:Transcript_31335/g.52260  ORF Transcript_31335/g.52260 Transcript_31335/m.52260 type:complete len:331 (-) Transcript_31335:1484-2476(-)